MTRSIQDRRLSFDEFYNSAVNTFNTFQDNDSRAEKFKSIYTFYVCPGSRAGGNNNRVVEVFFGSRPYEAITLESSWKALVEYGATLLFERNDSGYVTTSIYPAVTDNTRPVESSIALKLMVDPIKLNGKKFLVRLWDDFIAYMECTCLEGNPTYYQKQRVSYLRNFKHLIIDQKSMPTKFSVFRNGIFKLIIAACFSGAVLIYFVNYITKPNTTETDIQLKLVNRNLEVVSKHLAEISKNASDIKADSNVIDANFSKIKFNLKPIKRP